MQKSPKNAAYIDGANLYLSSLAEGYILDYSRFRQFLFEKYGVQDAHLFMGYIADNKPLYTTLKQQGYHLIFKKTVKNTEGKVKGNCDADLVLQATRDFYEGKYAQAVLVTSDGDFTSLAEFLVSRDALRCLLSPSSKRRCSVLLVRANLPMEYLPDFQTSLTYEKTSKR